MSNPIDNFVSCDALNKFEQMRYDIHIKMLTTIQAMNDKELQQLRECCQTATTTNCSWAIYEVKNHAATMASIESNKRKDS